MGIKKKPAHADAPLEATLVIEQHRPDDNLPSETLDAIMRFRQLLDAANALKQAASPSGTGAGASLIAGAMNALRARIEEQLRYKDHLEASIRLPYRLLVVGQSQVGKSTLVNVLANARVLATTGAGDAKTLKETVLSYSRENDRRLNVRYITKQQGQQRRFALENYARKQASLMNQWTHQWENQKLTQDRDLADAVQDAAHDDSSAPPSGISASRPHERYITQIKEIIYPECRDPKKFEQLDITDRDAISTATAADWVDAWCMLLGQEPVAGARFHSLWRDRLDTAKQLVGTSKEFRESAGSAREFARTVEQHTAESIAYLVDHVEVSTNSEFLEQIVVEDLPGVGNFSDASSEVAAEVLEKAIRTRNLDGIMVVTRQNGLDKASVELLEHSKVLERVIAEQIDVAVAITHIDRLAHSMVREYRNRDAEIPSRDDLIKAASAIVEEKQRQKLTELLTRQQGYLNVVVPAPENVQVLERTCIAGVDAYAAEAYLFNDDWQKQDAISSSFEATGVARLLQHFKSRANERHEARLREIQAYGDGVRSIIDAGLASIISDNDTSTAQRLAAEAKRVYIEHIDSAQLQLSNDWTAVKTKTRVRLDEVVKHSIAVAVSATTQATRDRHLEVIEFCRTANNGTPVHFMTMCAALLRNGTWVNGTSHKLNLPGDLETAFLNSIVHSWAPIHQEIVSILRDHVKDTRALLKQLEELARTASYQAGVEHNADAIKRIRLEVEITLKNSETALSAIVVDLKGQVRPKLQPWLQDHFAKACQNVLERVRAGEGYTVRLIREYDKIGASAAALAGKVCADFLTQIHRLIKQQTDQILLRSDPVAEAFRSVKNAPHDLEEPKEIAQARAALVAWARARTNWADRSEGAKPKC